MKIVLVVSIKDIRPPTRARYFPYKTITPSLNADVLHGSSLTFSVDFSLLYHEPTYTSMIDDWSWPNIVIAWTHTQLLIFQDSSDHAPLRN